ncbi:MAG: hypothetical protein A2Y78_15315 [Acidobacteria bacterium RBG_13_68_16]|nr:MAG: hypothetical protein A2Y78_15315 [Acidobacteria bacterium RBG_13_68_16]
MCGCASLYATGPRRIAAALIATLLAAGAASAAAPAEPTAKATAGTLSPGWVQLALVGEITLGAVGAGDLFGGAAAQARGADAAQLPPAAVSRAVPRLAQLRVADGVDLALVQVSFELVGANGKRGVLSGADDPNAEIAVVFEPLPLQPLGREGGVLLVDAGAIISLDFSRAGAAGRYAGQLTVTVNGL